jgi:hypothetical protein
MKRAVLLLAATVTTLLAARLASYLTHPLSVRAYHLWLLAGLIYLVCSLVILLEAPLRRVLLPGLAACVLRRVRPADRFAFTQDGEISRVA